MLDGLYLGTWWTPFTVPHHHKCITSHHIRSHHITSNHSVISHIPLHHTPQHIISYTSNTTSLIITPHLSPHIRLYSITLHTSHQISHHITHHITSDITSHQTSHYNTHNIRPHHMYDTIPYHFQFQSTDYKVLTYTWPLSGRKTRSVEFLLTVYQVSNTIPACAMHWYCTWLRISIGEAIKSFENCISSSSVKVQTNQIMECVAGLVRMKQDIYCVMINVDFVLFTRWKLWHGCSFRPFHLRHCKHRVLSSLHQSHCYFLTCGICAFCHCHNTTRGTKICL